MDTGTYIKLREKLEHRINPIILKQTDYIFILWEEIYNKFKESKSSYRQYISEKIEYAPFFILEALHFKLKSPMFSITKFLDSKIKLDSDEINQFSDLKKFNKEIQIFKELIKKY